MAYTTPDNLRTPDAGDVGDIPIHMGVLAQDVQDALNRRTGTGLGFRETSVNVASSSSFSQAPLTNLTTTGTTIRAVSNGFEVLLAGHYLLTGRIRFAPNSAGNRAVNFFVNGADTYVGNVVNAVTGGHTTPVIFSGSLPLDAGDVVTLHRWQNSGGTLAEEAARMTIAKIS